MYLKKILEKLYVPFYGWISTVSRLQSYYEEAVYFLPQVPRDPWYSFDRPRDDKRLSRPSSHPVALNKGHLDWESSALITRPLLHTYNVKKNNLKNQKCEKDTM